MKPENLLTGILVLGFLVIFAFSSCSSASGHRTPSRLTTVVRAKILETNTIDYVLLDSTELKVYRPLDSVWVNLATHKIDASEYTMKCVLYATPQ